MGKFTHRSKDWESGSLWFLPVSVLIPGFSFFSLFYIGIKAKKRLWVFLSIIYPNLCILSLLFSFSLFYIVWATSVIVLFITRRTFLERLDISTRQPIKWDEEYDYSSSNSATTSPLPINQIFISNLKHWRKEIESHIIQNNIDRMIEIAIIIYQKDSAASNVFFARHADTIDKMLRQYNEIEDSALNTPVIQESKEHIISVIETARKAFEQELTNMFKSEILNTRAESDAYLQNLRDRGLIE